MELHADWIDGKEIQRFTKAVQLVGSGKMSHAENRAINHTGFKARTQVRRVLPKQTGLKRAVIMHAVKAKSSRPHLLTFTLSSMGGDVGLKHFKARETRKGVTANPFGKRTLFDGAFIRGGRFPNRSSLGMGGTVFSPDTGSSNWYRSFTKTKSGVVIPHEMVTGSSADAFTSLVRVALPARLSHEINRLTGGVIS